jgi:glutathione peroxidase
VAIYDVQIGSLAGAPLDLAELRGKAVLIVNVASKCGHTPQYAGLQKLWETYRDQGLVVLGAPCNQFGAQEPGTVAEIQEFCQINYGVSFPLTEKIDVNGPHRHALYEQLVPTPDADGTAGDVKWNFEKFLVAPSGEVIRRYRSRVGPDAPDIVEAVELILAR